MGGVFIQAVLLAVLQGTQWNEAGGVSAVSVVMCCMWQSDCASGQRSHPLTLALCAVRNLIPSCGWTEESQRI